MTANKCHDCDAPATCDREELRNPEYAARIVADVRGFLTASDFKIVPYCRPCLDKREREEGTA